MLNWKLVLCVLVVLAAFLLCKQVYAGDVIDIADLPAVVQHDAVNVKAGPVAVQVQLPWRKGVEKAGEELAQEQSGIAQGLGAIVQGQQAILAELQALRGEQDSAPKAPALIPAPAIPEIKAPLAERIKDRIEARKDAVADTIDSIVASDFARRALIIVAVVGGIWFFVSKHRKAGTQTLVAKGTDALALATAGTPLGPFTAALDKIVDGLGDKIRALDAKFDKKVDDVKSQAQIVALATPAPTQLAPVAPVLNVQ